jgi:hypothetical protein
MGTVSVLLLLTTSAARAEGKWHGRSDDARNAA